MSSARPYFVRRLRQNGPYARKVRSTFWTRGLILCAGCGDAAQWLGAQSGDEFRDAISCAQAAAERPVCSQSDVHFSLKSRGCFQAGQGGHKGRPKDPKDTPVGPKAPQRGPKVPPKQPKRAPKTAKRTPERQNIYAVVENVTTLHKSDIC